MPVECLIALGSNLGDRAHALSGAVELIGGDELSTVLAVSRWQETPAIGGPAGQAAFLNGAARLATDRNPQELLELLRRVESALGRRRDVRWGPRTVDLDLLLYGDRVCGEQGCESAELTLPHPRMSFRRFVLEPAAEIAADLVHPLLKLSVGELLANLNRPGNGVTLAGATSELRRRIAAELAVRERWRIARSDAVPEDDDSDRGDSDGRDLAEDAVLIDAHWARRGDAQPPKLVVWFDTSDADQRLAWRDFERQGAVLRLAGGEINWRDEIVAAVAAMQ
jgi:2-amino-4-hydroxy-6-hydroxymethyldihydropteridine diphosphokinase